LCEGITKKREKNTGRLFRDVLPGRALQAFWPKRGTFLLLFWPPHTHTERERPDQTRPPKTEEKREREVGLGWVEIQLRAERERESRGRDNNKKVKKGKKKKRWEEEEEGREGSTCFCFYILALYSICEVGRERDPSIITIHEALNGWRQGDSSLSYIKDRI
jgi:hypothetical protein